MKSEGDVEEAVDLISRTKAIELSRTKAKEYAAKALEALADLPDSIHKQGLRLLAETVVDRKH